jgi:Cu+-exporting ATPase
MMEKHSPNGPTAADQGAWIDPVCGMTVTAQSPHSLQHQGRTVYFCCAGCAAKFRSRTRAAAIGRQLGITDIEAEVLPAEKSAVVERLQAAGDAVAMAGDGVNDAPALALADVGIAMGTGTEVAIESAGILLVKGDLTGIVRARALSRATMRNIRQNLVLAFLYNAIGIPIAAGVLYPAFGLLLSPMIAAAAMSLSSLSVIGNALRLRTAVVAR